jgi:hypothetical protein
MHYLYVQSSLLPAACLSATYLAEIGHACSQDVHRHGVTVLVAELVGFIAKAFHLSPDIGCKQTNKQTNRQTGK